MSVLMTLVFMCPMQKLFLTGYKSCVYINMWKTVCHCNQRIRHPSFLSVCWCGDRSYTRLILTWGVCLYPFNSDGFWNHLDDFVNVCVPTCIEVKTWYIYTWLRNGAAQMKNSFHVTLKEWSQHSDIRYFIS